MGWLQRLLLHNWWLKLLALALAYMLWSVVIPPESGSVVQIGVSVPLELVNLPAELEVVGEIPSRIHLHLRGSESQVRGLKPEDVGVRLDLSEATPGNHRFPLRAENVEVPAGIEVVRVVPGIIQLALARRVH